MQENLARGLQVVSRAVSTRNPLPVLSNVLLRTEDAGLKLTATNLEIGITAWVPGRIDSEGSLTVPARLFSDVVSGLPAGERVDLEMEGTTSLRVRTGRAADLPDRGRSRHQPRCGHHCRPAGSGAGGAAAVHGPARQHRHVHGS